MKRGDYSRVESDAIAQVDAGARIALLNIGARREIETLVRSIEKIETAVEPKFQEYFVDAMDIPNKSDKFPKLFSEVRKPATKSPARDIDSGRSRRRRRKRAS